jgi:hypothetical protein
MSSPFAGFFAGGFPIIACAVFWKGMTFALVDVARLTC